MKVLFTAIWYPHRYDAMDGLFVRKHAEAVSRYADVCVLFAKEDKQISQMEIIEQYFGRVKEVYIYYPASTHASINLLRYYNAVRKGLKRIFKTWGKPDITHANVFTKPAMIAFYLKKRYHIPYVVMEHWSGYLAANGSYAKTGKAHQYITRQLATAAKYVLPVSRPLKEAMIGHGIKANYQLVNNVVDDFFYQPATKTIPIPQGKIRMVHVSCFCEEAKNIFGILRTIKEVSQFRNDFECVFVGTGADFKRTTEYAASLNIPNGLIRFTGEQTPEEVCEWLNSCHFMLMFSNYENAPVVISEALATGIPVLSSNVGGISDMVPNNCGILVPARDEQQLKEKIIWMLDHYQEYDNNTIRQQGLQYSYDAVGKELIDIYSKALSK